MVDYWIRDAELRVLGPVSLPVLRDLVESGRLQGVEQVSEDGVHWVDVARSPLLAALLAPPPPDDSRERERADARRLRERMEAARGREPHELFRVPPDASLSTWRAAYFALARRFHPARLPAGTHPELVAAFQEAFAFFAERMAEVERRLSPPAPPAPAAAYREEDFVGLQRREDGRVHANVRVTLTNFRMFTAHRLLNISSGGMFLTTQAHIPLGTQVDVELIFESHERRIGARTRVVWESAGSDARHEQGVGLKFIQLTPEDATFIHDFVRRAAAHARQS
jgi:uncharacterized protein (TIGR02266 family)